MNSGASLSERLPERPFVGMRPFEAHEKDIFFGRTRDAEFICDKIFASRLTILYAPSGIGKSSVLRVLVAPTLRNEGATVVYFDDWSNEPERALAKAILSGLPQAAPAANEASTSLYRAAAALTELTTSTLVLILDQFEDFLTRPGLTLDPLRQELGSIVRAADLNVHVLISLRQEFLASLEPFREEILGLFESTFMLGDLDGTAVDDAIVNPISKFGGSIEPALVDKLKADLRVTNLPTEVRPRAAIDLPMMQLACTELWDSAPSKAPRHLTVALYEGLKGIKGILTRYVQRVVPRGWFQRLRTAKLMIALAPPSGVKRAYSVEDLHKQTGIRRRAVEKEIKRLLKASILRSREIGRSVMYELRHDALIKVLTPWRDNVLKYALAARYILWVAGPILGVCVVWLLVLYLGLYQSVVDPLAELELAKKSDDEPSSEQWEVAFDRAAFYALESKLPGAVPLLRHTLNKHRRRLPPSYGHGRPLEAASASPAGGHAWSLQVRFSKNDKVDEKYSRAVWREFTEDLARNWNLSVDLDLRREDRYPKRWVALGPDGVNKGDDNALLLDDSEDKILVYLVPTDYASPVFESYRRELTQLDATLGAKTEQWWTAPRSSYPAWKINKSKVVDSGGFLAVKVYLAVRAKPQLVFAPIASHLLESFAQGYPCTSAEAARVHGKGDLTRYVVAAIQADRSSKDLPRLLYDGARYPKIAPSALLANYSSWDPLASTLVTENPEPSLGATLLDARPLLQTPHPADRKAPLWHCITALQSPVAQPDGAAENAAKMIRALPPAFQSWLAQRYFLTDVAAVIQYARRREAGVPEELSLGRYKATRNREEFDRATEWTLPALVFWTTAYDVSDLRKSAEGLRATIDALRNPGSVPENASAKLTEGVRALEENRYQAAAKFFAKALAHDRQKTIHDFVALFAASAKRRIDLALEDSCGKRHPARATLDNASQRDLTMRLAERERSGLPVTALRFCLAQRGNGVDRISAVQGLLQEDKAAEWDPDDAAWLALQALDLNQPTASMARRAQQVFLDGFRRSRIERHPALLNGLLVTCITKDGPGWCYALYQQVAELDETPRILTTAARGLSESDRLDHLQLALSYLDRTLSQNPPPARGRAGTAIEGWVLDRIQLATHAVGPEVEETILREVARADPALLARRFLAEHYLHHGRFVDAISVVNSSLPSTSRGSAPSKASLRAIYEVNFLAQLVTGDAVALERAADLIEKLEVSEDQAFLLALTGILMESKDWEIKARSFISDTLHPYRIDLAMLMSVAHRPHTSNAARDVIEEFWADSNRGTWTDRLQLGDMSAWREMLVGYYLKEVSSEEIFGPLEAQRFDRSDLRFLPMSRDGLLCEAHFYAGLRARDGQDSAEMLEHFKAATAQDKSGYIEYYMAHFLMRQELERRRGR